MRSPRSTLAHRSGRDAARGAQLLLVSLIAGSLAIDAFTASARSAEPRAEVVVAATLLDVTGAPVAHTPIQLGALVQARGLTLSEAVASTTTAADGSFTLTADPAGLPRDDDGLVQLEVATVGTPDAASFVYDVRAMPAASGRGWSLELPPVSAPADAQSAPTLRGKARRVVQARLTRNVQRARTPLVLQRGAGLIADTTSSSVRVGTRAPRATEAAAAPATGATLVAPAGETPDEPEESGSGSDALDVDPFYGPEDTASRSGSCRAGDTAAWANMDSYKWNWVPTKYGRTLTESTFKWVIGRSHETDLQASLVVSGTHSAGGFMGSLHEDSDLSVEPVIGHRQRDIFYMKWRYRRQQRICVRTNPAGGYYRVNAYRWVPDGPTGGNLLVGTAATFDCGGSGPKYHDYFSASTTLSRGTTVTYDGFLQVAGVRLDAKQADGSHQSFTIRPNPGGLAEVCGSNDKPISASLVKEV